MEYRICSECEIHHYENCPNCLGFGVRAIGLPEGDVPIIAAEAHGLAPLTEWMPCPECYSTPRGVPAPIKVIYPSAAMDWKVVIDDGE